jgi:hypothetical protein
LDELHGTCSTHGKNEKFQLKILEGKHHLGDTGVDGRRRVKCILRKCGKMRNVFNWHRIR